jgi:hypothetical protein
MTPFIHFKDGGKEEIWMPAKPDKMTFTQYRASENYFRVPMS